MGVDNRQIQTAVLEDPESDDPVVCPTDAGEPRRRPWIARRATGREDGFRASPAAYAVRRCPQHNCRSLLRSSRSRRRMLETSCPRVSRKK